LGTVSANILGMSLKTFRAPDGTIWTAWRVETGTVPIVPGTPSMWLAFQNEDCTERRRLLEVPEDWEQLSDQLLDLLRRMAEPVASWRRPSPAGGVEAPRDGISS
jgi:hypothetical protein